MRFLQDLVLVRGYIIVIRWLILLDGHCVLAQGFRYRLNCVNQVLLGMVMHKT